MTETPSGERWALPGTVADPEPDVVSASPSAGEHVGASRGEGSRGGSDTGGPPEGLGGRRGARTQRELAPVGGLISEDAARMAVPRLELRPMTAADILDGAFDVIRARAARVLGFTALLVAPVHLLLAFLQRDATSDVSAWDLVTGLGDPEVQETAQGETATDTDLLVTLGGLALTGLVLVAVASGVAYLMGCWVSGRDAPVGELLVATGRRAWPLAASWVVVHLAQAPGLLACGVGWVFIMPFFVAVAPAIGAEQVGAMDAVKRSVQLCRRRYWPVLGVSLLIGLVAVLLNLVLSMWVVVPGEIAGWDVAWPLLGLANIMSSVVTTAFVATATVLLYLDLRVRSEGLDLELAAREALPGGVQ